MSTRSLVAATITLLLAGCVEPPLPPAIVGEDDAFSGGVLRALHADAEDLYFSYGAAELGVPVPGADAGVYRVALAGGEPTLLVPASSVLGVERAGDALVMVTRELRDTQLVTLPLDGSAPSTVPLTDDASIAATSSSGYTFVLASDSEANGRMSITRLATESEPELVFAVRERAFVYGWDFHALDGDLYWMEGPEGMTVRIADDQSQAEPEELRLPPGGIPATGEPWNDRYRLLGTIGGELFGSVYVESFFATGGTYSDGDPKGYDAYGGGGIYTVGDDDRLVAADIVQAVVAGDTIYGQNRDGDIVQIDPTSGETTTLVGHAPIFAMFTRPVVNDDSLFYADAEYLATNPIRVVSLAPRD